LRDEVESTPPVRPELVEALSFPLEGENKGFDRLSPNGEEYI
jgi:hypothetical protein